MTRVRLVRFEHSLGAGERATRAPVPALSGIVSRPLTEYRHEQIGFGAWLEPPRPELTLMITLEGAITENGRDLPAAWIGGLSRAHTIVGVGTRYAAIDLKLDPLGARAVLRCDLSELDSTGVALGDAFGQRSADELLERLHDAAGPDARLDVLERFLVARVADGPRADPAIAWAWRRLHESAGRLRVAELAAELRMSRRHLTSRFHAQAGLPPKVLARQLRFAEVRRRIELGAPLARVAAEVGYADQAHLARDFSELAGVSATDYLARQIPAGGTVGDGV